RTEAPERRSFAVEPFQHCTEHRQAMVAAALTLLRGFVAAGTPRTTPDRLASYEHWADRVRQAVLWLAGEGVSPEAGADPGGAMERAKEAEPEHQKLVGLLTAAHTVMSGRRWRVADLIQASELAVSSPTMCPEPVAALREFLLDIADDRGRINPRILGRW